MKNRVEIAKKNERVLNEIDKDFGAVLNQYHDYKILRSKYYYLSSLGFTIIIILSIQLFEFELDTDTNLSSNSMASDVGFTGPLPAPNGGHETMALDPLKIKKKSSKKIETTNEKLEGIDDPLEKAPLANDPPKVIKNSPAMPLDGFPNLYEYFSSNLTYPEEAILDSVAGTVKITFTINPDSSISHLGVFESLGEAFDNEAIRLVQGMPMWIPAIRDSIPVSSSMIIPVRFEIEDDE